MPRLISEERIFKYWFFCYPFLFGLAYSQAELFKYNQNTKLIPGLALAGYKDLASDWMARTTDTFPLFSALLKWQYEIFGLHAGIHGMFLLLVGLYGITSVWMAKALFGKHENQPRYLFIFSLIWMFLHWFKVRDNWQLIVPDGLGEQYILRTYYQPCVYGVLLLTGTAAYVSRRTVAAAILLILGALIHPTYLISSSLIAATIILLPANRALGITWRQRAIFISVFAIVVGAYSQWMIGQVGTGDPAIQKKAHTLLAETRIPHHALPSSWDLGRSMVFLILCLAGAWIGRRELIGQLLLTLLLLVAATLVWTTFAYNPTIAVAAPWRISAYLAPLSWIVIISSLAFGFDRLFARQNIIPFSLFKTVTMFGAFISAIWGIVELSENYSRKKREDFYALSRAIETVHHPGNQYLVPIEDENIGMEAGVPVYVTWKTHPTKDSEFLEWHERIEIARAVYEGNLPDSEINAYLEPLSVTHVVWPVSLGDYPYASFGERLYEDKHFSLWDMRSRL